MIDGLLRHDDPRLSLPTHPIGPTTAAAAMMVATLANLLRGRDEGALAAPAAGFAQNFMVVKTGKAVQALFDPVLTQAGSLIQRLDETGALTGDLIRATMRAATLRVTGAGSDAKPVTLRVEGALAIEVQQALDLLAGQSPTRLLSPYQRAVIDQSGAAPRLNAAFATLLREITTGTAPDDVTALWPFLSLGRLGRIDLRDPAQPASPVQAAICALSAIIPAPENVLLTGDNMFGMLPALVARWPQATLHLHGPEPLTAQMLGRVAASRIVPAQSTGAPRYDLILASGDAGDTRALARTLRHPGGVALVGAAGRNAGLEQRLKQAFLEVHCAVMTDAVVYAGLRDELDMGGALAGLLAHGAGQNDLAWLSGGFLHLGKDGRDRPLPFAAS